MMRPSVQFRLRRARLARSARLGFTLLELMVAGTAGAIAVSSMFYISGASTNYFREQQRISNMQSSLRYAMDQVRRDVSRAGFGATPDHGFYAPCSPNAGLVGPGGGVPFQAISVTNATTAPALIDPVGGHSIDGAPVEGDTLTLLGNYATPSEYRVSNNGLLGGGGQIALATDWMTFTRDLTEWVTGPPYLVNADLFNDVFLAGRLVRYQTANGDRFFSTVAGTAPNANPPTVTLGTPLVGIECAGNGATINPVAMMEYAIAPAVGATVHADPVVSGVNTQLIRREIGFGTGGATLPGTTQRIVAERVVHFNVDLLVNQNGNRTTAPLIGSATGPAAETAPPARIFSALVTLAVRGAMVDRAFPWVVQVLGQELTRYRFDPAASPVGSKAARVRVARAEIFLPNIAYEWMD